MDEGTTNPVTRGHLAALPGCPARPRFAGRAWARARWPPRRSPSPGRSTTGRCGRPAAAELARATRTASSCAAKVSSSAMRSAISACLSSISWPTRSCAPAQLVPSQIGSSSVICSQLMPILRARATNSSRVAGVLVVVAVARRGASGCAQQPDPLVVAHRRRRQPRLGRRARRSASRHGKPCTRVQGQEPGQLGTGLDLASEFKAYGRPRTDGRSPIWRRITMAVFTRDNTEVAVELDGLGQQHRAEDGGMHIALERWNAGLDTGEMFADLPDGACQEPHWGYVLSGSFTMRYTDGEHRDAVGRPGVLHPAGPQRPHRRGRRPGRVHAGRPDAGHQHRRGVARGRPDWRRDPASDATGHPARQDRAPAGVGAPAAARPGHRREALRVAGRLGGLADLRLHARLRLGADLRGREPALRQGRLDQGAADVRRRLPRGGPQGRRAACRGAGRPGPLDARRRRLVRAGPGVRRVAAAPAPLAAAPSWTRCSTCSSRSPTC